MENKQRFCSEMDLELVALIQAWPRRILDGLRGVLWRARKHCQRNHRLLSLQTIV